MIDLKFEEMNILRKTFFLAAMILTGIMSSEACSNIIVGRKASTDGSCFITYSCDSYGSYGFIRHFAAGKHPKGEKIKIYDRDNNKYHGEIDQVAETYNVVGHINEHQLSIGETTFGGREELVDTKGALDYGNLIYLALQRAKTAREAIKVMAALVEKYGYCSEGETYSIADTKEAWIMEMIGKGPDEKGAVWVAVRIPDDCVCAHANQSRIHRFMQYDKKDCLYSKDVVSFARKRGYFTGKDEEFDFANAYCPINFDGARFCEARVWSIYKNWADGMDSYFNYSAGLDLKAEPLPLFVKPNKPISLNDVQNAMRDQYEGTELDMTKDVGAGAFLMPYRPRPLTWEYNGKKYFNERPVATPQSAFVFVAQMRDNMPNPLGGVLWFANDDAKTTPFTPVYCCVNSIPECYAPEKGADDVTFSLKSAFWVCNWVANMVYPRFSMMFDDLKKARDEVENECLAQQNEVEKKARELYDKNAVECANYLTEYSKTAADKMMKRWIKLGQFLIVKYNDMVMKPENNGVFERTPEGMGGKVINVGFPDATKERIIKETGTKFEMPEKEK